MRGQKACITISKPAPKDLTQVKASTLRDAEMQAARETITAFDKENTSLRQGINALTEKISELQSTLCELMTMQSTIATVQAQSAEATPTAKLCEPGILARAYLAGTPGARLMIRKNAL
jgi:predicted RNase H-like nuclease (RuvC/YqgF family)